MQWQEDKSIPLRAKLLAIFMITLGITISIAFFIDILLVKVFLGLVGLSVIIFLWKRPTRDAHFGSKHSRVDLTGLQK